MLSRRSLLLLLTVALAVTPALALAGSTPPRPKAGNWKATDVVGVKGGSFKITKDRSAVIRLRVVPDSSANTSCDSSEMRVVGRLKLSKASRGGTSAWIVGKNRPQSSDGIDPVKVTLKQGDRTLQGTLEMVFSETGRAGSGQFEVPCGLLAFNAKKVK